MMDGDSGLADVRVDLCIRGFARSRSDLLRDKRLERFLPADLGGHSHAAAHDLPILLRCKKALDDTRGAAWVGGCQANRATALRTQQHGANGETIHIALSEGI